MRHWSLPLMALALLLALAPGADAQPKDTLTVALISHAPTLDPHMHFERVGDDAFGTTAAVGTGPWKFVEWKRDQYIRLEAFDGHWRGKPAFKHLVVRAIPEVATQIAEIKTGGVDLIRNVSADIAPELKAHAQTYVSSAPILRVHYVELDMRSAPFDKKLVRQAADLAIDKQAIIQRLMGGLGTQGATVVQPPAFGHDPEVQPFPFA